MKSYLVTYDLGFVVEVEDGQDPRRKVQQTWTELVESYAEGLGGTGTAPHESLLQVKAL
jgi:hypothetical protein